MFGFLKLGAKVVGGISNLIKKVKAKKAAKIEKAAAKLEARRASLAGLDGSYPSGATVASALSALKISAAANAGGKKPGENDNTTVAGVTPETDGGGAGMSVWLWPVAAAVAALFLLPKLLKK